VTRGPVGLWQLVVRPLGIDPRMLGERALVAVVVHDGTLTVADACGSPVLAGAWRLAGAGRVLLRFEGRWGTADAAVELGDAGRACRGRVMGRPAAASPGEPFTFVAEVVGRRQIVMLGGAGPGAAG
jgi:hypothetical protein